MRGRHMREERWSGRHHELALCAVSLSKGESADFDKRRPELVEGLSPRGASALGSVPQMGFLDPAASARSSDGECDDGRR